MQTCYTTHHAEQSRAEHVCIVITSGPVIKIDAGATPFLGNVLESWHGDGGATAHLDVLLCWLWFHA